MNITATTLDTFTGHQFTVPEGVVTRHPNLSDEHQTLLVTDSYHDVQAHREAVQGHIMDGSAARTLEGWFVTAPGSGARIRVHGAPINPDPVNSACYRVLGGPLVQYWDEDNRGNRHRTASPWNIIGGIGDAPWPLPADSYTDEQMTERVYVLVVPVAPEEELSVHRQSAGVIENVAGNNTFGIAAADAEGMAVLRPEPVAGEPYLVWRSGSDHSFIGTYLTADDRGLFALQTLLSRIEGSVYHSTHDDILRADDDAQLQWTALRTERAETADKPVVTAAVLTRQTRLQSRWDSLDEALTETADDEEWCSDFESIVRPLGFTGRRPDREFDVRVNVSFTMTDSTTSGQMDRRLSDEYDLSDLTVSELRIEASTEIMVRITARNGDQAMEAVGRAEVEEKLESLTGSTIEVDEWEVREADEAEDIS
jgi:hypothetical protein